MPQTNVLPQKPHVQTLRLASPRKGFTINVAANLAFGLLHIIVGMWFTPYLIDHLGIAVFGIISLANSLVVYMKILTDSFNSAVVRFLTIDLNRGDVRAANRTFNTALFGTLGLVAALIPIAALISLVFPHIFDVPSGFENDASWFFIASALTFCMGVVTSNFAVSSFAYSRFVSRNLVSLLAMCARIGLVVLLFSFFPGRVWYVGLGLVLAAVVSLGGYVYLWRRLTPQLRVWPKAVDRTQLRPLMGMGGWVSINRVGSLLLKNLDLIIVNSVFGAAATGGYGAVLQITRQPQAFVSDISSVINPIILSKYAQGDILGLKRITIQATKLMGLGLALPVGLLCGFSRPLLSIWLGPSFVEWSPVLIALVGVLSLNLSMRPGALVQTAYNRVRWPGIAMVVSGVINALLATGAAIWGGLGPLGVAIAGGLVWTVKNVFFFPIYTAHVMEIPWYTFLPSLTASVVGTLAVGLTAYGLTLVRLPTGWLSLGLSASIVSLFYVLVVSLVGLNNDDWKLIKSLVFRRA